MSIDESFADAQAKVLASLEDEPFSRIPALRDRVLDGCFAYVYKVKDEDGNMCHVAIYDLEVFVERPINHARWREQVRSYYEEVADTYATFVEGTAMRS